MKKVAIALGVATIIGVALIIIRAIIESTNDDLLSEYDDGFDEEDDDRYVALD